jgi:hypothetical protein
VQQKFTYHNSCKIIYWGCSFDSLLELKYAISIRSDYEFLRSHIPIYYDPVTRLPTNYIRDNTRRYTPDFLIRHKITGKAEWVEIKPRAFEGQDQLELRKAVANNYIKWKNLDWVYKVIYDDEITLTGEQQAEFNACSKLKSASAWKLWFEKYNKRFDRSQPSLFTGAPGNKLINFVMFGQRIST